MIRSFRRRRLGFTLVELCLVVAIVGILAAIATYGVRKYAARAKTAEAMATVGAIGRAVHSAAARDFTSTQVLALGESSTSAGESAVSQGKGKGATVTRGAVGLCANAEPVPASMSSVKGKKYQPDRRGEVDYNTGDTFTGWRCLRFAVDQPQYYQYQYKVGGPPVNVKLPHGGSPHGLSEDHSWVAMAQGDLDGDGQTSWFALTGYITDSQEVVSAPAIGSDDEEE